MAKRLTTKQIIRTVTGIRRRNNNLWMSLLALALKLDPERAQEIIREIVENDKKVSKWMSRI